MRIGKISEFIFLSHIFQDFTDDGLRLFHYICMLVLPYIV